MSPIVLPRLQCPQRLLPEETLCWVHYFPFPNNGLFLHFRDQYSIVTQAVEKFLFLWNGVDQKHKSVWQKYPTFFFTICWKKLIPFINVDHSSFIQVDVRLGICDIGSIIWSKPVTHWSKKKDQIDLGRIFFF